MTWAEQRRNMDEAQAEIEADAEMEEEEEERQQLLWGTWDELLLACAVQRYGTRNWDLISNELQARNLCSTHVFSPQACKARYDALQGRFNASLKGEDEEEEEARPRIPWLDELRRLRVAQLRRELQRSDDSIGCLQSKLQRLEAERVESQRADSKLDLDLDRERERSSAGSQIEEQSRPADPAPQNRSPAPEPPPENRPTSDPAPEQQLPPPPASPLDSFYGSSETLENAQPRRQRSRRPRKQQQQPQHQPTPQLQHQQQQDGPLLVPHKEVEDCADVAATAAVDPDDDRASIGCTDGPDAQPRQRPRGCRKQSKSEPSGESERRAGNVPLESDVLSSANQGKNADAKESVDYGATRSSGDSQIDRAEGTDEIEHENDNDNDNENENDNSPMSRRTRREPKVAGKLLPLLDCLRAVASHKFGHIFKHRLESQKTQRYRELIRRHMDLSTIRSRLEDGTYSGSTEFFRDLLLVFNNALVYFPRSSQEHAAARQLQQQARKEMAKILQTEALLKQDGPSTRKREPRGPQNSNTASPAVKFPFSRKRGARSTPGRPKSGTKTPEKLAAEDVKPTEMLTPKTEEKLESSATAGARVNGEAKKSQKSQSQVQTKKEAENAVKPESNSTPPPVLVKRGVGRPPKHARRQQSGAESAPRPRKRPRPRR